MVGLVPYQDTHNKEPQFIETPIRAMVKTQLLVEDFTGLDGFLVKRLLGFKQPFGAPGCVRFLGVATVLVVANGSNQRFRPPAKRNFGPVLEDP